MNEEKKKEKRLTVAGTFTEDMGGRGSITRKRMTRRNKKGGRKIKVIHAKFATTFVKLVGFAMSLVTILKLLNVAYFSTNKFFL
jgi:hypothetical protein